MRNTYLVCYDICEDKRPRSRERGPIEATAAEVRVVAPLSRLAPELHARVDAVVRNESSQRPAKTPGNHN